MTEAKEETWEIWVKVGDGMSISVPMPNTATIGAFFGVLKTKFADELAGIGVSKLVVKAPKESLAAGTDPKEVDPTKFEQLINPKAKLAAVLKPSIAGENGEYEVYVELPGSKKKCTFPKEFKIQAERKLEEHKLAATDAVIARATKLILENTPKMTTAEYRVPPVMITALARSGKTTTLKLIFNRLLSLKSCVPIFVTFNGDSGFKRDESKSDMENFLRAVITQLVPDAFEKGDEMNTIFSKEDLNSYLNTASGPIILLLDEINVLGPLSVDLASLLREMFLDPKNRYLCITSHWVVNLSEALGTAGLVPSPRETCPVPVAFTMDLDELKTIAPVTACETALFAGLPGLIYSVKMMRPKFDPNARFSAEVTAAVAEANLSHFLKQFCSGKDIPEMREFSKYTYRDKRGRVVWPLCYAEPFLEAVQQFQLSTLIADVSNAAGLRTEDNGLEWEYTAQVALGMVAFAAAFRPLTDGETKVMGEMDSNPRLVICILDKNIETLKQAQTFIGASIKKLKGPVLALAFPTFGSFPLFDGIIRYVSPDQAYWRGVQMKLGRDLPTNDCPDEFEMGVLLRGDPPTRKSQPSKLEGWIYLNLDEITSWLPYSMRSLLPREWRDSEKKRKRSH